MTHDSFFKEFFRRFLPTFIHLFFPNEAEKLDFTTLNFLDKELIINLPQQEVRIGDVLAEVRTFTGQPQTLLIHIEVEGRSKKKLPQRLFEYYGMIRLTNQQLVLPITFVLLPGTTGLGWQIYQETLFDREIVRFQYAQIGIRDLPAELYAQLDNPLAAALAVLMKVPGRVPAKWQKLAEVKLNALQTLLINQDLTEGDKLFLIDLVKRYLPAKRFPAGLKGETMQSLQETEQLWHEQVLAKGQQMGLEQGKQIGLEQGQQIGIQQGQQIGLEQGQQIGLQQGQQIGQQQMLLQLMSYKFGTLPAGIIQQIQTIQDLAMLDKLGWQLLKAQSLDEMALPLAG